MEDIPSCCPLYKGSSGLCPANISRSDAIIKLELCVSIFMFIHYLHIIPDISIREMAAHFFFSMGAFQTAKRSMLIFQVFTGELSSKKHLAVFREIYNKKVILFFLIKLANGRAHDPLAGLCLHSHCSLTSNRCSLP